MTGKSTISTTITNFFDKQGCLGAFLFFERDTEERNKASSAIRTLAQQLASSNARIQAAIALAIEKVPRITQAPLRQQFTKPLVEPLSNVSRSEDPIVLVFDALDGCGSAETRKDLLSILGTQSTHLPSIVCVLTTYRTEFDIKRVFQAQWHIIEYESDLLSDNNNEDIFLYLRNCLEMIRADNMSLPLSS
jgi:hypothetical protein